MPISKSACGLRNSMHHPGNAGSDQCEYDAHVHYITKNAVLAFGGVIIGWSIGWLGVAIARWIRERRLAHSVSRGAKEIQSSISTLVHETYDHRDHDDAVAVVAASCASSEATVKEMERAISDLAHRAHDHRHTDNIAATNRLDERLTKLTKLQKRMKMKKTLVTTLFSGIVTIGAWLIISNSDFVELPFELPFLRGFSDKDIQNIKEQIKAEAGKDGTEVVDVQMYRESRTKLVGWVKIKVPLLGEISKHCTATLSPRGPSYGGHIGVQRFPLKGCFKRDAAHVRDEPIKSVKVGTQSSST